MLYGIHSFHGTYITWQIEHVAHYLSKQIALKILAMSDYTVLACTYSWLDLVKAFVKIDSSRER